MKDKIQKRIDDSMKPIESLLPPDMYRIVQQSILNGMTFGVEMVAEHFHSCEVNEKTMLEFLLGYQKSGRELQAEFTASRRG